MTPRQVRSVLQVMESGSVNQAAAVLHLAPSSVSAQLRELSEELGVKLFESAGRGIIPSRAAYELKASLQSFLAQAEAIRQLAQELSYEPAGTLHLYAPSSMCIYRLPPLIEALQHHAPQVEVMLNHEPFDYRQAFQRGELDAMVLVSQVEQAGWIHHPLYAEPVLYVCHPKRHQDRELSLSELAQQPLITTEAGCSYRVCAEAHFRAHGLTLKPRQSFANVEVIRRCLLANMGIGLLPACVVAEDLAKGALVQQAVTQTPYPFHSFLIYPAQRPALSRLKALLEVIPTTT